MAEVELLGDRDERAQLLQLKIHLCMKRMAWKAVARSGLDGTPSPGGPGRGSACRLNRALGGAGTVSPMAVAPGIAPPRGTEGRGRGRLGLGRRRADALLVAVPTLLAGALSAWQLSGRSLGFDETATATIAAQHGAALVRAIEHDGGNMSGYYLLLHVLIGLFGDSATVLRLPSVLAAAASAGLVAVLGLRCFDRRVALAAALLTAVSLPLVFWGQSARGYAPMVALTTASYVAFVALIDRARGERPVLWQLLAYALCMSLAMYATFVAVLVIPAQLVTIAALRDRRAAALRAFAGALALYAAACVPLVVLALQRGSGQLFWVARPTLTVAKQVAESITSAGLEPSFRMGVAGDALLAFLGVVLIAVIGVLVSRWIRDRGSWPVALVLAWLLVPLVLVVVESELGDSIFLPRNLLMTVPAVALALALVIFDRRLPALASWSALAALLVLRALVLVPSYGVSPEDWRGAAAYVGAHSQPADCVAFYPSDGRMGFEYYLGPGTRSPTPVLPSAPWRADPAFVEDYATLPASELGTLPSHCPRLWLVSSHEGQPNGPSEALANRARYLALRASLTRAYGSHSRVRSFGYAAPVHVQLFVEPAGGPGEAR